MDINKNLVSIVGLFVMLVLPAGAAFADGDPWFTQPMKNSEAILGPGDNAYCNKSFVVENMGKEDAEVHVIMGNGDTYHENLLPPNEKLAYSLTPGGAFATVGEGVQIDEARIVNTGNETLKIHCK